MAEKDPKSTSPEKSAPKGREVGGEAGRTKLPLWQGLFTSLIALLVFCVLLEGALALLGVDPVIRKKDPFVGFASDIPLFVEKTGADGEKVLSTAKNRLAFFNQQQFALEKSPGTYRIFCLGGSTTYGRPYNDTTSFAGWLRELLPVADPQVNWEVINAGGISYASYRVSHLMEELLRYQPDLFVIYTGHNEFLEERTYRDFREVPAVVRSAAAVLARTRTWAVMDAAITRVGFSPAGKGDKRTQLTGEVNTILARSVGPEQYERNDPLRDQILDHYRISLERMADMARSAGAEVIFVTPASNLKDCTPFKSQHTDGLTEAEQQRSEELLATARDLLRNENPSEALPMLDEAIAFDPRYAELHYRRGKALLALGRYGEADAALRRARDEDVCPLRALSPIPEIMAKVAREKGDALVDFIDLIEKRIQKELDHRIPGQEYFLDHVHPTIEGNRLLAAALVEAMREQGIAHPTETWGGEAIAKVAARVEGGLDRDSHGQALANLAKVLRWSGKEEDAERLARQAIEVGADAPEVVEVAAGILGELHLGRNDLENARRYFRMALRANPRSVDTHLQIGLMFLRSRQFELGAAHLLHASAFLSDRDFVHQMLGLALAERGRYPEAYLSLSEAVRLNPANSEAKSALARLEKLLGTAAPAPAPPKVSLKRYPSGIPKEIGQVRSDATGRYLPNGMFTEWYESGELKVLRDYVSGVPNGIEMTWDREGRLLSRGEYRNGIRVPAPEGAPAEAM